MKTIAIFVISTLIQFQFTKAQSTFITNEDVKTKAMDCHWSDSLSFKILLPNTNEVEIFFDKNVRSSKVKKVGSNEYLLLDFALQKDYLHNAYWYFLNAEIGEVLIFESYFPNFEYLPSEILNVSIIAFDNQGKPYKQASFNSIYGGANLITKSGGDIFINIFKEFTNYKSYEHSKCLFLNKFVLDNDLHLKVIENNQFPCYEILGESLVLSSFCCKFLENETNMTSSLKLEEPYRVNPIKSRNYCFSFNKKVLQNKVWINTINDGKFELLLPNDKILSIYNDKSNKFSVAEIDGEKIELDFILQGLYFRNAYWYSLNQKIGKVLILESHFPYAGGILSNIVNVSIIAFDKNGNLAKKASFNSYRGGANLIHLEKSEIVISIFDKHERYDSEELVECYHLYEFTLNDDFSIKNRITNRPRHYESWYGNLIESNICEDFTQNTHKFKLKPFVVNP